MSERTIEMVQAELREAESKLDGLRLEHATLKREQARAAAGEQFTCPLSIGHILMEEGGRSYWERRANGDRCCSFCGSWHQDEFTAWCQSVLSGELPPFHVMEDYKVVSEHLSLADSRVKFYVSQAGVSNALDGAIKLKTAHLSPEQLDLANKALRFVREAARAEMQRRGWT